MGWDGKRANQTRQMEYELDSQVKHGRAAGRVQNMKKQMREAKERREEKSLSLSQRPRNCAQRPPSLASHLVSLLWESIVPAEQPAVAAGVDGKPGSRVPALPLP
ncbi:hypothetical protein H4R99_005716 [Coemansia sp. RSA 1722]|nr:hypothetical protein IWW45_006203 [Coemansia sp. RSA 485]KAJ2594544.1 hypothetical protein H4R99_005716 [Coemansia sp. RSA 1722]